MDNDDLKKIDVKELPWFYRLALKIPGTEYLDKTGGIFWTIGITTFIFLEFFLSLFLLMYFPFPLNIALTLTIPFAILLAFVKITLKRFLNWWNAVFGGSSFEWNVDRVLEDYISLLEKQKKRHKK
jgi:hypothetical protein